MQKSVAGALTFAVLAGGCGGSRLVQPATTHPAQARSPEARHYARDYARLYADIRAMRAEAANFRDGSLLGTPGLRRTTAKFIGDLERSSLGPKARNRMIDHAAAAVATSCEQCFQMLEAIRPIPQIAGR